MNPASNLREGCLYVTTADRPYGIVKILKIEDGVVHVTLYKNKYSEMPEKIDPASLTLGTLADLQGEDGFGVAHLPLRTQTWLGWSPEFLQLSQVEPEELEGYRLWKESSGGAW